MSSFSGVMVYVRETARAAAFYREVLGSDPTIDSPHWTQFDLGGGVFLGLHPARGPVEPGSGWTPGFSVDDLRAARERLISAGGTVSSEYHDVPGGVVLGVADPDGNVIQVQQNGISCADLGVASR